MKKNITKRKNLDVSKYVNIETGQPLSDEVKDVTVTTTESTELFTIQSKDFVTIDSKAILYICTELSNSDCARFTQMASMLKTEFNIVFNHNIPHTLDTLSKTLNLDKDNTTRLLRRLMSKGLLACVECAPSGYRQKIYMLNPSVVRKRKTFNKELLIFFKDYSQFDTD